MKTMYFQHNVFWGNRHWTQIRSGEPGWAELGEPAEAESIAPSIKT